MVVNFYGAKWARTKAANMSLLQVSAREPLKFGIEHETLRHRGKRYAPIPAGSIRAQRAAVRVRLYRAHKQRSEEHTSELQSLMRISYAVFCLKKKTT